MKSILKNPFAVDDLTYNKLVHNLDYVYRDIIHDNQTKSCLDYGVLSNMCNSINDNIRIGNVQLVIFNKDQHVLNKTRLTQRRVTVSFTNKTRTIIEKQILIINRQYKRDTK